MQRCCLQLQGTSLITCAGTGLYGLGVLKSAIEVTSNLADCANGVCTDRFATASSKHEEWTQECSELVQLFASRQQHQPTNLHEDEGVEDHRVGLFACFSSVPHILVYAALIQGVKLLVALAVSCAGGVCRAEQA